MLLMIAFVFLHGWQRWDGHLFNTIIIKNKLDVVAGCFSSNINL